MATTAAVLNVIVSAQTGQAQAALARVDKQLKGTAASGAAAGQGVGRFDKASRLAAAGGVAGLAYGLYKSIAVGMDFEKQMSNLQAVTDASGSQMERFSAQASEMAKGTIFGAREVAQAQTELAKAGLRPSQILGGALKSALDLAAAGEMDLADAANVTANALNLFSLPANRAGQVADMLATAANTTTAEVADFAMALTQGGSAAKQVGFTLNDTVVVLEALARSGIKNSDAGTSMKTALLQLAAPTARQAQLARQLGLEFTNQAGEMKAPIQLAGVLQKALSGMTKAQRTAALKVLAGTDGFRTLAALYDLGAKRAQKLAGANREVGSAAKTAADKTDNLAGDLERAKGEAENLGITLYGQLSPYLRKAAGAATKFGSALNSIDPSILGDLGEPGWLDDLKKSAHEWKVVASDLFGGGGNPAEDATNSLGKYRAELAKLQGMARTAAPMRLGVKLDSGDAGRKASDLMRGLRGRLDKPLRIIPKLDKETPVRRSEETWRDVKSRLGKPLPKIKPDLDRGVVGRAASLWEQIKAQFPPIEQIVNVVRRGFSGMASGGRDVPAQVALVGERGRELMRSSEGWTMLGAAGPHLAAIPEGADIFTASETRRMLRAGVPGFSKGKKKPHAKPQGNRWEAALAAAERTAGTADDISAINNLIGYWKHQAKKFSKPVKMAGKRGKAMDWGQLTNAHQQVKSYRDMLADLTGGASATDADSGLIDLLRSQLASANLRYAVSQAQGAVLRSTPYVGSFAGGGMVPGPVGAPALAVVHGGEAIGQPGNVLVIVEDGAVDARKIRVIAGEEAERFNRRGGRAVGRTPGRAGAL